jgi:hypothetical protein
MQEHLQQLGDLEAALASTDEDYRLGEMVVEDTDTVALGRLSGRLRSSPAAFWDSTSPAKLASNSG